MMKTIDEAPVAATAPVSLAPRELDSRIAHGELVQIIDVREFPEFAAGHISCARLVPLNELEARTHELDPNVPVVCVCHSGKRSAMATEKLMALGFANVTHLEGGVLAWERCGLPLTEEPRGPWSLERQGRCALGVFVLIGLSLSLRWSAAILISWIIGIGMVFTSFVDWCGMAPLLAKAPWNQQQSASCAR